LDVIVFSPVMGCRDGCLLDCPQEIHRLSDDPGEIYFQAADQEQDPSAGVNV
jgi:hypothetical protein